jgi:ABC-2 type transport system ATP-binding protein
VNQSSPAIALNKLTRTFTVGKRRITALDGVTLAVQPGMVTGLIGPDGAGKTTLMRLCAGLLTPDSGEASVMGIDVVQAPLQVQAGIGYMPQRFGLYEDLTVAENMALYADLQGVPRLRRTERYSELLDMAGLKPFTKRLAGRLSGGMKQKLGLVCTLVRPPRLLLLDEPTVGVDPVSRRELWQIVYRLVKQEGMSVLLSTAYLDEAERCREVVLMHRGRILGQGPPDSFSGKVRGRTWFVTTPRIGKRRLQAELARQKQVLDALILGRGVRVVTLEKENPSRWLPDIEDIHADEVEPRFEDSFIDLLKQRQGDGDGGSAIVLRRTAADADGEDAIVVESLTRRFGDFFAVRGISFRVRHGEVFGLLGANGAGKTTTFRMLCGLLPISEGRCQVAGVDLRRAAARARGRIGYMAQKFSLYGELSVLQNMRFFSSAYGLRGKRQQRQIEWALATFDLQEFADTRSQSLPLGYKQRLALSVALMHEPGILFLDEPTSGVDPLARREFWVHINALAEQGVTVLVTTHFMEEAEYCDRLVIMAEGEVLTAGTPEETKALFPSSGRREVTMEDAFIGLLEARQKREQVA